MMRTIYLDHAATTPVDPKVLKAMQPFFYEHYGNPSSYHQLGIYNKKAINTARKTIAELFKCLPEELYFTSGGTEAINLAIKGCAYAQPLKNEIIITPIEHKATINAVKFLETKGYKIHYAQIDSTGMIDLYQLDKIINPHTLMVSVIWANNEIGTIQDISKILEITKKHHTLLHVDAVQVVGQIEFNLLTHPVDLLTCSAHKFYGPKGIGCLYVKKDTPIVPIIHGGGHEYGIRAGTENLMGIVGMEKAMCIAFKDIEQKNKHLRHLSKMLYEGLKSIYDVKLNGPEIGSNRLPGHLSVAFKALDGFELAFALDQKGVCTSTGSACSSQIIEPSHVLKAIKVDPDYIKGTLRLTLGYHQTESDIKRALTIFKDILEDV